MKYLLMVWVACCGALGMVVADDAELFTNIYVVPPTFLSGGTNERDLTRLTPAERYAPRERQSAKSILEKAGIKFEGHASAIYNASTSELIVRNTQEQMELVEAYIGSTIPGVEIQIYLIVREVSFSGDFETPVKPTVAVNGAQIEIKEPFADSPLDLFHFPEREDFGKNGVWTHQFADFETFRDELAQPPRTPEERSKERRIRKSATLTDPQFQLLIRAISQDGRLKFRSFPSLMLRSGDPGIIQAEKSRIGMIPVLGANETSIDLDLFIPRNGEALFEPSQTLKATITTTLNDGETVVVAEKNPDGNHRLIFVYSQLMDPAGMPIHGTVSEPVKDEPLKLPAKFESGLSVEGQWAVKSADEFALKGSQLSVKGDFDGALKAYTEALAILPKHEITAPRHAAYRKQLLRAQSKLGKRSADSQHYIVREGETLEQIASRFGLEVNTLRKTNRLGSDPLQANQILLGPFVEVKQSRTEELLKTLILPGIDFKDAPLATAIATLQEEILRLHDSGLFPEAVPIFLLNIPEATLNTRITLKLSNVPAVEALRYTTSLAQCRYQVIGREVRIVSLYTVE